MVDFLEGFTPHLTGVYGAINFNMGGETESNDADFSLFLTGRIGIEAMLSEFESFYLERASRTLRRLSAIGGEPFWSTNNFSPAFARAPCPPKARKPQSLG